MKALDLSRVSVEDFLEALGVENIKRVARDEYRFSCPFPGHTHGDDTPSAYMNTGEDDEERTTLWKCHGCGRSGNAVKFLALHEGISPETAARYIREEYDATFREPEGGSFISEWEAHFQKTEEEPEEINPPIGEHQLEKFYVDWADAWCEWNETKDPLLGYMFNRGFEPETLMDAQIGWDEISRRFTIPVRNVDGELIGFKGRTTEPEEPRKYLVIGDTYGRQTWGFAPYEAKMVVYGLDEAKEYDDGITVEGELNRLAMKQKGYPNSVAVGGANTLSDFQIVLIRHHFDTITLFFDSLKPNKEIGPRFLPDKAGLQATLRAIEAFEPHMRTRVVDHHLGDPADMEEDEIHALVGEAVSSLHITIPL